MSRLLPEQRPSQQCRQQPWLARIGLLALMALALSACSTRIDVPERRNLSGEVPADWRERERALLALDQWVLRGKIAVRQADQSESALINRWQQDHSAYALQLSSAFLGMGSVQLQGDSDFLLIRTGDGERYVSDDPEQLIQQVTGWRLPLAVLPYWVRGVPAPTPAAELGFSPEGQLSVLIQAGWEVHFQRYSEAGANQPALPSLITATNGSARVRLAVSEWQFEPRLVSQPSSQPYFQQTNSP